jgi:hypothetical protein
MFSSDYPHPEGTTDPLGRFERTLSGVSDKKPTHITTFWMDTLLFLLRPAPPSGGSHCQQ